MRPAAIAALLVVAAVVGGVAALALGRVTGLDDEGVATTVYVSVPLAGTSTEARVGVAPPELGNGFDPAAIYARRSPGVVTIYTELGGGGSQGSGFVVGEDGTILTNAHVITDVGQSPLAASAARPAERVFVEFKDGERVPASIVGWDVFADIGVVSVDPKVHPVAPLPLGDSSEVVVGTPVAAIGSPFGNQSSLAVGVVSATGRSIPSLTSRYAVADAIQVDAPINRGNSGGPLLDSRGNVIGVNAQIRSNSGTAEGVGFAIPINVARRSLQQLLSTGSVAYAYIGVKTQDVTPGLSRRFELVAAHGALVAEVERGTPAARAGLRGGSRSEDYNGVDVRLGGDLIVRIGARAVASSEDVSRIVSELLPGQRVPFTIVRNGERRTIPVVLGERPLDSSG